MLPFDYKQALYRKNNQNQPCVWYATKLNDHAIIVSHGILGKTIVNNTIITDRNAEDEIESKIKAKRKTGYKYLHEVKDDSNSTPIEGELINFLRAYLPGYRTTSDGSLLPMLAKTYDNSNNKLYKKATEYIGQFKINGLRCFISAEPTNDIFKPVKLKFQSREGVVWNSLVDLEEYILMNINKKLLNKMLEEYYILDGELYLPGASVNEINHYVKDPTCKENKLIQYWCYDLAVEELPQIYRIIELNELIKPINIENKNNHLNNTNRFISLPYITIDSDSMATTARDIFINEGFEGLILRNPDAEYQFGKRNLSMIKYKRSTDGKFLIVDIKPEGVKRPDIPIFVCKNDINDQQFEVHVGGSMDYQRSCLIDKDKLIGKYMMVEYGERSGVDNLPFHVKKTFILY